MAIDSTIYAADIPAGTYAVGDIIPLVNTDGPANVRSGRGAAILKSVTTMAMAFSAPFWRIHIKNSDWIDDVISMAGPISTTSFDDESGCTQGGHDCKLTPNSGWQIYAECILPGTSTVANSIVTLIDVDYPEVGGVTDPRKAVGFPTSIDYDLTVVTNAYGTATTANWVSASVDYLKAGYKYVLDAVEFTTPSTSFGFIAFSNAAGMGGLTRIIPIYSDISAIRYSVKYSSVLQKGPMDVKVKLFEATSSTMAVAMVHDYVKQKA